MVFPQVFCISSVLLNSRGLSAFIELQVLFSDTFFTCIEIILNSNLAPQCL